MLRVYPHIVCDIQCTHQCCMCARARSAFFAVESRPAAPPILFYYFVSRCSRIKPWIRARYSTFDGRTTTPTLSHATPVHAPTRTRSWQPCMPRGQIWPQRTSRTLKRTPCQSSTRARCARVGSTSLSMLFQPRMAATAAGVAQWLLSSNQRGSWWAAIRALLLRPHGPAMPLLPLPIHRTQIGPLHSIPIRPRSTISLRAAMQQRG